MLRSLLSRKPTEVSDPIQACLASAEDDENTLVGCLLKQGRYALLLRAQLKERLDSDQLQETIEALQRHMAIVPEGEVVVGPVDEALDDGRLDAENIAEYHGRVVYVAPLFLDRCQVTNAEYFQFVAAGGYAEMSIWDEAIWPAVLDFVDQTGEPGPRFWRRGKFNPGEENLPVVGVSWYEAAAYARWVGKRLPTDAEWNKAGAWPVSPREGVWLQRKYPWGSSYESQRANLWSSQIDKPVAVDGFKLGVSVGGIYQLIGNVWEWTASNFGTADDESLSIGAPMKSIRGGAFDTYFESQATCHFQSGENPLARKHNVGFRLAVSLRDVHWFDTDLDELELEDSEPAPGETCEFDEETDLNDATEPPIEEAVV